mmetsp:Transcript_12354/g.32523  ORF Transcript_12354/g.32523 Transcript_12354/m.32523 type:complete len:211 (+) Transcript_12354:398-1030(+)
MSNSKSSSISFQYCTTLSSSVQSLTTTQAGRSRNGRNAAAMSPSVASPSLAMTTQAFVPVARNSEARCWICRVTARIWAHNGVRPVGWLYTNRSMRLNSSSDLLLSPVPTATICDAPEPGWFSRRNSVHAPNSTANRACQPIAEPSSSQREQGTRPWRPPAPSTTLCPSFVPILPELSMIQKRYEKSRALWTNCSARPRGMPMCSTVRMA